MAGDDYPRHLVAPLEQALAAARIVNLVGPRQVGKTTLVQNLFGEGFYVTLDDAGVLAAIESDPVGQMKSLAANAADADMPVIIDEVQRSGNLPLAIKSIVDKDRRKGQFLLTGSSNVFATMNVADSLAGRMLVLKLWPLTMAEKQRVGPNRMLDWAAQERPSLDTITLPPVLSRKEYIEHVLEGGFPEPRELPLKSRQELYRDYVDSVVDRDVVDLFHVRKTEPFRRLIDQVAARTGQEINISDLSRLLGIKRDTVDTYLDALIRLSLIIRLGAWNSGETHREVRQPKYHLVDTGMCCALRHLGANAFDAGRVNATQLGGLMESFVFNEILRSLRQQETDFRLYHWRSPDRRKIDIIADGGECLVGIQVKSAATINNRDFRHLKWFAMDGPGKSRSFTGIVFYLGEHRLSFGNRLFGLPVSALWSNFDRSTTH